MKQIMKIQSVLVGCALLGLIATTISAADTFDEAVNKIDSLVMKDLKAHKISPNKPISDTQFVRRVYLDLIGRIPTTEELNEFLTDKSPNSRANLISKLLNSDGHQSHMFNWFADMLRIKDDYYRIGKTYTFHTWLKNQLSENRPYNEIVFDMMTAEGRLGENGATAYLLRDASMPLDSLSNTLTTFLGANVSCAQCHDHPFAEWTQKDFYQMAAFFGSTAFERVDTRKPAKSIGTKEFSKANLVGLLQANMERVVYEKGRSLKYPEDYAYDDAKPNKRVIPKFIQWSEGENSTIESNDDPLTVRKQFGTWLTSKENPRFSAAITNRLWKKYFGVAIKEPITDLDSIDQATNPELLKYLAQLFKDLDFNLREFQKIVLNTKAYQRNYSLTPGEGKEFRFPGPLLRRMTAEQIWDSSAVLIKGDKIDRYKTDNSKYLERILLPDDIRLDRKGIMNDKEKVFAFARTLVEKKYATGSGRGRFLDIPKLKNDNAIQRASELPQPMDPDHFLRIAGQSSRELADDNSTEGGISESLAFMNGELPGSVIKPESQVVKLANDKKTDKDKVTYLYQAFLSRTPTDEEIQMITKAFESGLGTEDVIWALLNSREFIFIQ